MMRSDDLVFTDGVVSCTKFDGQLTIMALHVGGASVVIIIVCDCLFPHVSISFACMGMEF